MAEVLSLPIRTTVDDVLEIMGYLATKSMGAYPVDAKRVLDAGTLDARKLNAMRFWGLMEDSEGRYKATERGRLAGKEKGAHISAALGAVIRATPEYMAIIERAVHREEYIFTAIDVATHWHEHFKKTTSSNEKILNDQAVCFFQVAAGAQLGTLVVGRKGSPTRFEFSEERVSALAGLGAVEEEEEEADDFVEGNVITVGGGGDESEPTILTTLTNKSVANNRVFITHGRNKKVLDQIKELVSYGAFQPVIAQENESIAKPVPDKVMDDMRSCAAAVIHVSSEGTFKDKDGVEKPRINENVLIEIGAAMALYRRKFILVVEEGLQLPSNLQGLYECRYRGDELNMEATMKLLKAFADFRKE